MKSINYKYINILLLLGIAYLLFLMQEIWVCVLMKIFNILLPFLIAFIIAYVLYPFLKYLTKRKIPKWLGVSIIVIVFLLIVILTLYLVFPVFVNQLINLFPSLTKFTSEIAINYNIDMDIINEYINKYSSKILEYLGTIFSNGAFINVLNTSVNFITNLIIIFIVSIYFLFDMKKIRQNIKNYLLKKNKKKYELIRTIDKEIYAYLKGLGIFTISQFFEYTILFLIIGHPHYLLIGFLACITTIIPYFGGLFTNILALLIASVISKKLFIMTLIITIVFPNIDSYIISPKIYGKTNQMPALLTIFSVAASGALFGFIGIIIAVPLTIIIMVVIKAYKGEIEEKISSINEKERDK